MKEIEITEEKSLAIVNGKGYSVPVGTTLANLDQYLSFNLNVADLVEFVTFEAIEEASKGWTIPLPENWVRGWTISPIYDEDDEDEEETYISPFTGEIM